MAEMANAGEDERDVESVADGDSLVVFYGAARLDNRSDARFRRDFGTIGEGEKSVRSEGRAPHLFPGLLHGKPYAAHPVHLHRPGAAERLVFGNRNRV